MTNNLLKNLLSATVIIFTVGVGGVWAQDMRSNLSTCEGTDVSRWDKCYGSYSLGNGHKYIGEFISGKQNGEGTAIWDNGTRYEGEWLDNNYNGIGKYTWPNGDEYIGMFQNGSINGQGLLTFFNGMKQEGIYENGKFIKAAKVNLAAFERSKRYDDYEIDDTPMVTSEIGGMDKIRRNLEAKRRAAKNNQTQTIVIQNKVQTQSYSNSNANANAFEQERQQLAEERRRLEEEKYEREQARESERQQIASERKRLEEEKRSRAQAKNNQRINLQISNTQPNANGEFTVTIKTNSDTASLKINGDEQGGREDGVYQIKRIARAGQVTQLIVFAEDVYGNTDTKTIAVNRKITQSNQVRYAELNPAQIKSQPSRDAVAIIIGIADYKNLPRADFANEDARAFYDYAIRGLGVRAENIKLLVDAEADEIEILRTFKTWLPARVKATTDVYVYYSGHGLPTDDGTGLYLLPQRADRDFLSDTALQQERINQALQAAKPKSVTIFLDSCYSGMARTGQTLLASARPITLKASAQTFPADFTVISASTSEQISSSSNELKHGIFSYYLMKGMEGDADTNKDGKITAGEMHGYLLENVARQASLANRVQQPQLTGDANRVLVGR